MTASPFYLRTTPVVLSSGFGASPAIICGANGAIAKKTRATCCPRSHHSRQTRPREKAQGTNFAQRTSLACFLGGNGKREAGAGWWLAAP